MSTLGERLKKARERKGLSQIEVFRRTHINNKTLSRYEKDGTEPDTETLKVLSDLYEVSTDYLLGKGSDSNTADKSDSDGIPSAVKAWLRADTTGLTDEEQEMLQEDLSEYFEMRKNRILKSKNRKN
ncbi:helix-turn-helix transcriptional regulator [Niallia taxi]|uniref:helix-turn-helix domain-containing protein n=1 Tax=Niallia taxi TaxID=2499688 RepID=UPI00316FD1E2